MGVHNGIKFQSALSQSYIQTSRKSICKTQNDLHTISKLCLRKYRNYVKNQMLAQEDMGSSSLLMPDKQGKLVRPRRFIHRVKIKYEIEEVLEPQESDIDFQEYDSTSATQSQPLASILSSTTPNP